MALYRAGISFYIDNACFEVYIGHVMIKTQYRKAVGMVLWSLLLPIWISAQEGQTGFTDADANGINDHFTDSNGDGINDVTGIPYPHHFKFEDQDKDGNNDLWADADGDGVNDLLSQFQKQNSHWVDEDGDGIMDEVTIPLRGKALQQHVLDTDNDGKNDITGDAFTENEIHGNRYGQFREEDGSLVRPNQANGAGTQNRMQQGEPADSGMDRFIDNDGDGIADDRGLGRLRKKSKKRR